MKRIHFIHIAISGLVILSVILNGCSEPEGPGPHIYPDFPKVSLTVTSVSATSAIFEGSIYNPKKYLIIERGFYWSPSSDYPTQNDSIIISAQSTTFKDTLAGLIPNTNYWVRAFAKVNNQTMYSTGIKFVTRF